MKIVELASGQQSLRPLGRHFAQTIRQGIERPQQPELALDSLGIQACGPQAGGKASSLSFVARENGEVAGLPAPRGQTAHEQG